MQTGIAYIREELAGIYPGEEIRAMASLVIRHIKSYSHTQMLLARNEILSPDEREKLNGIVLRLKKQEPLQYILGETEFFGLKILCRSGVLIPRPETEELVEWVLKECAGQRYFLDIGTGTGCLPIALKKNLPEATVSGCDISETCIQLARENAALNETDVSFFRMDILQPEEKKGLRQYDVLVSNPPYVRESEKKQMQPNVLYHEPALALFVPDDDPLRFYRALLYLPNNRWHPKAAFIGKSTKYWGWNVRLFCSISDMRISGCEKTYTAKTV